MSIVLGDKYTVDLFKLMGFNGRSFNNAKELYEYLLKNLHIYNVFFISSNYAKEMRKELDELRMRNPNKVFVEVPSVMENMEREVNYLQLVRQVLGG
ncbi:V-type ATP synthase subunit F [Thermoproteus tenax]|uniref:H+-transporting A1A0 ATP synthase subunit F, V-type n=1 Tax=Thermoproteus tenax (strain ATCC 35583 / DSM 2078 / JCM 9277 / NBRC 100435 / Kra 1) TaxID=768679 RepID=G4RL58_THETK|nr:V-type ATP synthase subunit F [Thermoproteus tenax]CCC82303.1 H+-transporting A1A0 ATP synthase subunit F, V-type [Thermoproteus tenax Kra 1]